MGQPQNRTKWDNLFSSLYYYMYLSVHYIACIIICNLFSSLYCYLSVRYFAIYQFIILLVSLCNLPGRNPTQDPVGFDPTGILNWRNPTQDPIEFNRILSKIL